MKWHQARLRPGTDTFLELILPCF